MDRALDDIITERQSSGKRGGPGRRRNDQGRGGYRKNDNDRANRQIDGDWLHDRYDDEDGYSQPSGQFSRDRRPRDRSPNNDLFNRSVKLRVENLHYDLTEDDLRDLFTRIAPITDLKLSYDRSGRSLGTAYVTYSSEKSAREAIAQFDGANANGQPIRLSIVPTGPAVKRNPFDSVVRPNRSLAERIDSPHNRDRDRSRSPGEERRNNARRHPRDDIDRYVPRHRSRSPKGNRGARGGRGRGDRRGGGRGRGDTDGRPAVQGRPRYTQEELDKDMDAYWGSTQTEGASNEATNSAPAAAAPAEGDVDMVE